MGDKVYTVCTTGYTGECAQSGVARTMCAGTSYNAQTHTCVDGKTYANCEAGYTGVCADYDEIKNLCNGSSYSPETHFCLDGTKTAKCGGETYTASEICESDVVRPRCGDVGYDVATQGCYNNSKVKNLCKSVTTGECLSGTELKNKCAGSYYDASTQLCHNEEIENKCLATPGECLDGETPKCVQPNGTAVVVKDGLKCESTGKITGKFEPNRANDNEEYGMVQIGEQVWMAENLNYDPGSSANSWCYGNDPTNCSTYGRLYDWAAANIVCPTGWHLSSQNDWEKLLRTVGDYPGKQLRAKSGWDGTDAWGFSALPGGYHYNGEYDYQGSGGNWWEYIGPGYGSANRFINSGDNGFSWSYNDSFMSECSVRCVRDESP